MGASPFYKHWVVFLLYIGWCISFIDRVALSLSAPSLTADLQLSSGELGLLLSSFYFGYWLMQLPGGWLADRFGAKVVVLAAIGFWSLFTLMTGLSWSLMSLLVIRLLFGLGEGAFPSAAIKNAAENYASDQKPKVTSFLLSSNYVGSMIAPIMIAPLLLHFDWRHTFMIIGSFGLIFVLIYGLTVNNTPSAQNGQRQRISRQDVIEVAKLPILWKIAAVWFGLSLINKGLDSWMPIYLMTERHLDIKAVGVLLPVPYVMAALATATGGWVMVKFFNGRENLMLLVCALMTAFSIGCMYRAETLSGVIVAQAATYFFKSFVLAVSVALPTKMLASRVVGCGIGIINFGGQAAGFVAPLVIGLMVQHISYGSAFLFLMAAAIFSALMSLTIRTRLAPAQGIEPVNK
ncbi:TPA: MFS transporter [Klebsiella michiganensis]|uniref:MFS transporter n=1 Tax=Enterobacter hormaechei TaxID=158836 RepID=UPI00390819A6|nr:MFS transporter [Enterobacter hormaechei subsp. steigerwaltii]HAV1583969.1 MFS transporter [Enterobacter hormaechei subsp. steigerwaltii]HAV1867099.1 MFS transporter [Enterobacter hormaechei subsp. steigerwaltii]